jgi:hypothetical protein
LWYYIIIFNEEKNMGIQVSANRTDAYIGTFDYQSADDMLQLEEVRGMVKNMNKMLREDGFDYQFYVKCQGRGPRQGVRRYNQSLPLTLAERVDAYIYRRR